VFLLEKKLGDFLTNRDLDDLQITKFILVKSCGHIEDRYVAIFPKQTTKYAAHLEDSTSNCTVCFLPSTIVRVYPDWTYFEQLIQRNLKKSITSLTVAYELGEMDASND